MHRIEMTLPFGPPTVNVYLTRAGAGWLLIDAGMATRQCREQFEKGLGAAGIEPGAIHTVLISHLHPDHTGLAPWLQAEHGARVLMHREETAFLKDVGNGVTSQRLGKGLAEHGVESGLAGAVLRTHDKIALAFTPVEPDGWLEDGQVIPVDAGNLRVMVMPGHSPGHVCLWCEEAGWFFGGDHVIEGISPHIGWLPDADPLGDYLGSLQQLKAMGEPEILPSHGVPFRGLQAWIAGTLEHHEERCQEILRHLGNGAETVAHLVELLWPRALKPLDYQLGFTEVLSHLVYLERRGEVWRQEDRRVGEDGHVSCSWSVAGIR